MKQKKHNLPCKLNGRSLTFAIFTIAKKHENFITTNIAKKRATIPPISTKQTTTSHFTSLNTKNTITYAEGNPGHVLGQVQICGCLVFGNLFIMAHGERVVIPLTLVN